LEQAPAQPLSVNFSGDAHGTLRWLGMKRSDTAHLGWLFTKSRGDGTVPVWSAARNRSFDNLKGTLQSFSQHTTLFDDKWVLSILERELFEIPADDREPVSAAGRPSITFVEAGQVYSWPIEIASVEVDAPTKLPDENVRIKIIIEFQKNVSNLASNLYRPKIRLITGNSAVDLTAAEVSTLEQIESGILAFEASANVGSGVGPAQIITEVTDGFSLTSEFQIIDNGSP
jgi:hypothetical protein